MTPVWSRSVCSGPCTCAEEGRGKVPYRHEIGEYGQPTRCYLNLNHDICWDTQTGLEGGKKGSKGE